MQTNVEISKDVLDWVIQHTDMDRITDSARKYLLSWANGEKTPTYNQIELVSKATCLPLGYFFLTKPPIEDTSFVNYRTIDSVRLDNPSRNLIDIMHEMQNVQEWMREYLIADGSPMCSLVRCCDKLDIIKFAECIRTNLGINRDWFQKAKDTNDSFHLIRNAISRSGVIVMMSGIVGNNTRRPLDIDEFRAFAIVDDYAPLIFINANDSINGRLFSLLHELSHICLGNDSLFNDRYGSAKNQISKEEQICNAVAAEILVPNSLFIEDWRRLNVNNNSNSESAIDSLSKKYKCGITVIARKAYDLGYIDFPLYQKIAQKAIFLFNEARRKKKEKDESGGDFYSLIGSRVDRRFFGMLVSSVREGKTQYTDAFRLTNTTRSTFSSLAEKLGGIE